MAKAPIVFNKTQWTEIIQKPDWYLSYSRFVRQVKAKYKQDSKDAQKLSKQLRKFFEKALLAEEVSLGLDGPDWDAERQPVDTIVIHHTSDQPGYKLSFLNAVHLLNIYTPAYSNGQNRGHPIWSGHFYKGKQVFWGYHWLMRMDGSFERLLDDDQIGWQAGNWEINKHSIGICLDNDYEKRDPRKQVLERLSEFIKQNYPDIKPQNIIGHCEANKKTVCPGKHFINGWKPKLIEYLSDGS